MIIYVTSSKAFSPPVILPLTFEPGRMKNNRKVIKHTEKYQSCKAIFADVLRFFTVIANVSLLFD